MALQFIPCPYCRHLLSDNALRAHLRYSHGKLEEEMTKQDLEDYLRLCLSELGEGPGYGDQPVHTMLARFVGDDPANKLPFGNFENRLRALLNPVEIPNKSAVYDWIVVAYQCTGDKVRHEVAHTCPPRTALLTALSMMESPS